MLGPAGLNAHGSKFVYSMKSVVMTLYVAVTDGRVIAEPHGLRIP